MAANKLESFIDEFSKSLDDGTFVKATAGNYKGANGQLQKTFLRPVETRKGLLVQFVSRFTDRETSENIALSDAPDRFRSLFESGFASGHLFTTKNDLQLAVSKKGKVLVTRSAATFRSSPEKTHDRPKASPLDSSAKYLHLLGLTTSNGKVRDKAQAKFRQIGRFVSIVSELISEAGSAESRPLKIVDMGCGKGYLTFALYDRLANGLGKDVRIGGVEERQHLVDHCSRWATECGFEGLSFRQGRIEELSSDAIDVLIALHACDTATDEALFKGISSGAGVIVAAPCCQKELRKQLRYPLEARGLNRFPLLLERETESVTDGLRALLLESRGYRVKMQEFISPEHTPKNNLITAVLDPDPGRTAKRLKEAESVMSLYGVESQRLHSLLSSREHPSGPAHKH